jgi:hypothetical protein
LVLGVTTLTTAIQGLANFLIGLKAALEHKANGKPSVDRLALRLDELAIALGVSRRLLEREKAADRLPKPDMYIGRIPLWRPDTVRRWVEEGGHR